MCSVPHRTGYVGEAAEHGVGVVYWPSGPLPESPVTDAILSKTERNLQLQSDHLSGVAISSLAECFTISPQCVYQTLMTIEHTRTAEDIVLA